MKYVGLARIYCHLCHAVLPPATNDSRKNNTKRKRDASILSIDTLLWLICCVFAYGTIWNNDNEYCRCYFSWQCSGQFAIVRWDLCSMLKRKIQDVAWRITSSVKTVFFFVCLLVCTMFHKLLHQSSWNLDILTPKHIWKHFSLTSRNSDFNFFFNQKCVFSLKLDQTSKTFRICIKHNANVVNMC